MDDDKRTKEELLEEIEALKDEVDKFRLIETIFRQIERELRIKNKAISSSINPIIFCDLEGKINYVNAAFLEAWGYSYDSEIFGANVLELFFKDQARDELERIISDHGSWQGALSAKKKGGEGFFVQGALAPIKDDEGNEVCIMASFTDISLIKEKERNLLEAKDFLNSLINAIPEPVFVKDEEHKWVLLNDEVCERIGRSREELIGKSDYDIFPKEQADIFWEKDDQVFREGGTLVNEETIVFDGKNRIISTVKTLCEDDVTGRKIIIGTIRDITEGKLLENLLKESEKRYRALVEGVNQPIVRLKEDGTVLFLNNFAALELGGKPDDFTGRNILELFPEEPARRYVSRVKETIAAGHRMVFEGETTLKGESRFYQAIMQPLSDDTGHADSVLVIVTDVTDKKAAEFALKEQLHFLRQLIDSIPVPVFYKDLNGTYLDCNAAFASFFGMDRENVMGKAVNELLPADIVMKHEEMDRDLFSRGGYQSYEVQTRNGSGEKKEVIYNKVAYTDTSGKVLGLVGVMIDITELKKADEAVRRSEEKFRLITENASDLIAILTLDGTFVYASPSHARLGYVPEEMTGQNGFDLMHPDDSAVLAPLIKRYSHISHKEMEKLVAANIHDKLEFRFSDRKGNWRDMEATANLVRSLSGEGFDVLIISKDVTDRKRVETEIRRSYEMTLDIIENAPFGIYLVNGNGDIDYVNPAMLEISADKYADFTSMNVFKDLPGYDAVGLTDRIRAGLSGEYFEMKDVEYSSKFGGKTTIRNFIGIPMGEGSERKVLMIVEDITERKKTELELKERRDLLDKANRRLEDKVRELEDAMKHIRRLEGLVPICMNCKKMRSEGADPKDPDAWMPLEKYISAKTNASFTHGLCPECAKKMSGKMSGGKRKERR